MFTCLNYRKKESLSSDDFVTTISNWSELRDSVYAYISKDSAFYAHTYLSSEFYSIHDSIRTEMFRLAVGQDRTLKDVLRVKKCTSQYNNEEDIKTTFNSAKAFYASLDSLEVFKADKTVRQSVGSMWIWYVQILWNLERNLCSRLKP